MNSVQRRLIQHAVHCGVTDGLKPINERLANLGLPVPDWGKVLTAPSSVPGVVLFKVPAGSETSCEMVPADEIILVYLWEGEIRKLAFLGREDEGKRRYKLLTVADICKHPRYEFVLTPGIGAKTLEEFDRILEVLHLRYAKRRRLVRRAPRQGVSRVLALQPR